jgi:hypothetical protein
MVCARDATIPLAGLLIGSPMRKFRFALLSVVFIALAMGVCALQAGAALYQWLTGRTRRTSHRDRPEDRKSHVRHCRGRFIRLLGPRCRVIPARPDSKIVAGDLELLDRPSLAIVGTRDPTENGEFLARYAVSSRREAEAPVVSGLAYGIDRLVHEWCLNISLPTISVFGTGILAPYPAKHAPLSDAIVEAGGVVLTEYMPTQGPSGRQFVWRNRLQAAPSRATIPVEWKKKSAPPTRSGSPA